MLLLLNSEPGSLDNITPSLDDLGRLMRARTKISGSGGGEAGTFTDKTKPTDVEATAIIQQAVFLVSAQIGDVPTRLYDQAKAVVTLLAAQLVELSYYPEQTNTDQSAFENYQTLYEASITALAAAVQDDQPGSLAPRFYSLPAVGRTGWVVPDYPFFLS